jgi:hypothetical protein
LSEWLPWLAIPAIGRHPQAPPGLQSEGFMNTLPGNTFRKLPLGPEQGRELERYIHTGMPW